MGAESVLADGLDAKAITAAVVAAKPDVIVHQMTAQGQTVTCQATGHVGIVSPIRVYAQQHHCVKEAEANGYKKTAAPAGTSAS